MMKKYMTHGSDIQTGRNIVLLISTLFILSGCVLFSWDVSDDEIYDIRIKNTTKDTLLLSFDRNGEVITITDFLIYPDSSNSLDVFGSVGVDEGEDPIEDKFSGGFYVTCSVYQYSSEIENDFMDSGGSFIPERKHLKVVWNAPMQKMGDSINSYFNYDSWDYWFIDEKKWYGVIEFTIYEEDFVN